MHNNACLFCKIGCGKTTLTNELVGSLQAEGISSFCVSLDDFYLAHEEQEAILKGGGNSLLTERGLPGTHDMALLGKTLTDMVGNCESGIVQVPQYDKSAFKGQGDRSATWRTLNSAVDVVLFEGWMLGFIAISDSEMQGIINGLGPDACAHRHPLFEIQAVNNKLAEYENVLYSRFDAFIHLASDSSFVFEWRWEQEQGLVQRTGSGMSREKVRNFVDRFMVCYEIYLPRLLRGRWGWVAPGRGLQLELDKERRMIRVREL